MHRKHPSPFLPRLAKTAACLLLALNLAACGGGGGGTTSPDDGGNSGGTGSGDTNTPPVADAGADISVDDNASVTLDASGSSDADGDTLTYAWKKTAGPDITLDGADKKVASFTAPAVPGGTEYTFELTVSDGEDSATDTVKVTVNDVTAPTAELTATKTFIEKDDALAINFSEPVNPDSLALSGVLADSAKASWSDDHTVLSLTPKNPDEGWPRGPEKDLAVEVEDAAGNSLTLEETFYVKLVFETFQAADVVIGQKDMTSAETGLTAKRLSGSSSTVVRLAGRAWVKDGRLYIPDDNAERVLGFSTIPAANDTAADFVIGQDDFISSGSGVLSSAESIGGNSDTMVVLEYGGLAFLTPIPTVEENSAPGAGGSTVAYYITPSGGSTAACGADGLNFPEDMFVTPGGKLIVADTGNNRVLIWNSLPAGPDVPPDLVLGQRNFDTCAKNDDGSGSTGQIGAGTMAAPNAVWSDDEKLVVSDADNYRILIWNRFPTSNQQPADLVLGQDAFDTVTWPPTAVQAQIGYPNGIASNGEQLFVSDVVYHRVLAWNSWPTEDGQPADLVLGQEGFEEEIVATTAQNFDSPQHLLLHDTQLIVADTGNFRYLIFNSK